VAQQSGVLGGQERRPVLSAFPQRGFTMVELLVGITILAMLLALGAPAMGTYMQNSKLGSAASSYTSGAQLARAEAIRRNVRTELVLTDQPIAPGDIANLAVAAPTGRNWVARAASGASFLLLEARAGSEGEGSIVGNHVQISGAASAPGVWTGLIPFNGFGATADGAAYSIDIKNPSAGVCLADGGKIMCRRITISPGGQIVACLPGLPAGDSRAC